MSIPPAQELLDPSTLPSSSSSELILVPATPAEYEQTWLLNADEWRGPLTLSQYFERERFLLKQDLTKDGAITAWILTSTKIPLNSDGTRHILASVESLLKSGYVARDGKLENIRVHGVASVYTHPQYRGKGYASRMMQELSKHLETYQQHNGDRGTFSVLFSDIGKYFYAKHGWKTFPSTHIHLASLASKQYEATKTQVPAVRDIMTDDLNDLPTTAYLEDTLKIISKQKPGVPCVATKPDQTQFRWHHAREEISSKMLNLPYPHIKGAIHAGTGIAIIWSRVFASNPQEWTLYILHVLIPPNLREKRTEEAIDALASLLLRAQHEAAAWNMVEGVHVWDPTELTIAAAQRLRTEEQGKVEILSRDKDHICCLQWIGGREGDDTSEDVLWVNAEKYTWN